jgi:tetratricopeptide (TPR) repeat protein
VACAYCNIGDHLIDLGRWEEARDVGRQALAVAEEVEMPYWTAGAFHIIAMAELELGNPQSSLDAAEQALEESLTHGLNDRARWAYHHAAKAHEALGNPERAAELQRQSDELASSS